MKPLRQLFENHQGKVSDKWCLYIREYDRLFCHLRNDPLRILEIGIQNGGSLEIWSQYFKSAEKLVGCDVNPDCGKLEYKDPRIAVVLGDANSDECEGKVLQQSETFDVIFDDGSHSSGDIIRSFVRYFKHLKQEGLYVVEDLHCSYWQSFDGGLYYPYSSMSFFKRLADVLNYEHWGVAKRRNQILQGIAQHFSIEIGDEVLSEVHSVEFVNSMCVIRKQAAEQNSIGSRLIVGQEEVVVVGQRENVARFWKTADENTNLWSTMERAPDELYQYLRETLTSVSDQLQGASQNLAERDEQVAALNHIVAERDEQVAALNHIVAERDGQVDVLNQAMVERNGQVAALNLAVAERDGQVAALNQIAAERDRQVGVLNQAVAEREGLVAALNQAVAERDRQVRDLDHALNLIQGSRSWRLTRPVRWLSLQWGLLSQYGLSARLRSFVRKVSRAGVRRGLEYIRMHPRLRIRIHGWAIRLGLQNRLHRLYQLIIAKATDGGPNIRALVVSSYKDWSEHFDTPSMEVLDQLALSADTMSPVLVLARFDRDSEHLAGGLAQRLFETIGQPWNAIFLFSSECRSSEAMAQVRRVAGGDPRIRFDSSSDDSLAEIIILIEGGALPRAHSLRIFADALRKSPESVMVYADEDRVIGDIPPENPWFKPKFSPLLAKQGVLLGRMVALRTARDRAGEIIQRLLSSSTNWRQFAIDLAVDAGERHVVHVPHVLFHDALSTRSPITVEFPFPRTVPSATIIIPTKDRWDLLGPCLESLWKSDWPLECLDVVVVDNGSTNKETLVKLGELEAERRIRVIRDDRQFNWSRLNNLAARESVGELLVFLNNDTEVADPAWLKKLTVHALRAGVGAVGCKLLYPDRTVQHGGVIAGIQGVAGHAHLFLEANEGGYCNLATLTHEVSAVTGACLAVSRKNFELAGGFNEDFRVAFNDVVFCFTLHTLGLTNVYVADPLLIHHESKSRGYDDTPEKLALQRAEARRAWTIHAPLMRNDPFYSPNLSLWQPYQLAFAPRRRAAWDDMARRPLRVMMLSITHAIGHGVAVVIALQADALVKEGYDVIVAGPKSQNDFLYPGCTRIETHDPLDAATMAADMAVDVIVAHTPPFFGVARWTGAYPPVIAYDYGEPPPDWFPDAASRKAVLADKDQSLMMAAAVYAISDAIASESRTPVHGVIPLGNAHLGQWSGAMSDRRSKVRAEYGWGNRFLVLNVCRFHGGERLYKGVDTFISVKEAVAKLSPDVRDSVVFVLCGKGAEEDVAAMTERGLAVFANVTDETMRDLYCAADVYMNFSKWEGYNLGIGQALAMGLPTLASDIPAHRAFGIDVSDDVNRAAMWLLQRFNQVGQRMPKIWAWDEPLAQLIDVIEEVSTGNLSTEEKLIC